MSILKQFVLNLGIEGFYLICFCLCLYVFTDFLQRERRQIIKDEEFKKKLSKPYYS